MNQPDITKNSRRKVELGQKGEKIAADFLEEKGFQIIKQNYMIGHSDIDILAKNNEFLVFVEVRTKSGQESGMPEDTLTNKKLRRMKNTAELYIAFNHYEGIARLDAVCIILDGSDKVRHLEHYEGVG
ncbi:MAG: YraN family protein [Spirochaetales bacterium]|nr:YraN family protein [Spirochaetales bacterium]